ncbi:hypothetical protein H632_c5412p0, partial [Helicosporidium sp. ATCC 50920]
GQLSERVFRGAARVDAGRRPRAPPARAGDGGRAPGVHARGGGGRAGEGGASRGGGGGGHPRSQRVERVSRRPRQRARRLLRALVPHRGPRLAGRGGLPHAGGPHQGAHQPRWRKDQPPRGGGCPRLASARAPGRGVRRARPRLRRGRGRRRGAGRRTGRRRGEEARAHEARGRQTGGLQGSFHPLRR